ncbi:hypothetical protein Mapa_014543 [Marchantia paleacea]|nr:hypothetical protein Mapa_014543 [Marchantia paleacea]
MIISHLPSSSESEMDVRQGYAVRKTPTLCCQLARATSSPTCEGVMYLSGRTGHVGHFAIVDDVC